MTPARIFVHPRCLEGPASGALQAVLQEHGWDVENILIGPASPKGHCELVRHVQEAEGVTTYERMDGSRFTRATVPFEPGVA